MDFYHSTKPMNELLKCLHCDWKTPHLHSFPFLSSFPPLVSPRNVLTQRTTPTIPSQTVVCVMIMSPSEYGNKERGTTHHNNQQLQQVPAFLWQLALINGPAHGLIGCPR